MIITTVSIINIQQTSIFLLDRKLCQSSCQYMYGIYHPTYGSGNTEVNSLFSKSKVLKIFVARQYFWKVKHTVT